MIGRKRFRGLYGAGPLHLLALIASFAIAGAAVVGWFQRPKDVVTVLEWFAAAIVLHDLVALPVYTLVDRAVSTALGGRAGRIPRAARAGSVNPVPYLRIPALLSGLLLIVFFPVVFGLGAQAELAASGIAESGYLARWLLATGVMFGLSGAAYTGAVALARTAGAAAAPALQVEDDPSSGPVPGSEARLPAPAPAPDSSAPLPPPPPQPPGSSAD